MKQKIVAQTINPYINSSMPFPFGEWSKLVDALTPKQQIILRKSLAWFARNNDKKQFNAFKNEITAVANILLKSFPSVHAIYGVGYPFYGHIDFRYRLYNSLIKHKGEPEQNVTLRMLPDIDFLLVYNPEKSYLDMTAPVSALKEAFVEENQFNARQLPLLYQELTSEHNIAAWNGEPEDEFLHHGRLHIDYFPVPLQLFKESPKYYRPDDFKNIVFFRDLLFTCTPLATRDKRLNRVIPLLRRRFAEHLLNNLPSEKGTRKNLFKTILAHQPHHEFISMYETVTAYVIAEYTPIVNDLIHR